MIALGVQEPVIPSHPRVLECGLLQLIPNMYPCYLLHPPNPKHGVKQVLMSCQSEHCRKLSHSSVKDRNVPQDITFYPCGPGI